DVVLDLHPRRPVARDEFLAACHGVASVGDVGPGSTPAAAAGTDRPQGGARDTHLPTAAAIQVASGRRVRRVAPSRLRPIAAASVCRSLPRERWPDASGQRSDFRKGGSGEPDISSQAQRRRTGDVARPRRTARWRSATERGDEGFRRTFAQGGEVAGAQPPANHQGERIAMQRHQAIADAGPRPVTPVARPGGAIQTALPTGASAHPRLPRILRCIEAELCDPALGTDTLVRRFFVSRPTLYRMFRPLGGVARYIRERRLLQAHARLREDPDCTITFLLYDLGFDSERQFQRAFQARFGM